MLQQVRDMKQPSSNLNLETPGEESNFHLFRRRNKYIDLILFKSESINFAAHGGIGIRVPAKGTEYVATALPLCYLAKSYFR